MIARRLVLMTALVSLAVLVGDQTCFAKPAAAVLPSYPCRLAATPITVDGKLDEPAWAKAEPITKFYMLEPKGATPSPSKVRLLWDASFVYVAFEYEDDDIWSFSNKADDDLWDGDVAEFFIKPSTEKMLYYEFVMAPNGTLYDAQYPSRGAGGANRFKSWSSNANVATQINGTDGDPTDNDQGYVVEMAIPVTAFPEWARPAEGATWTFGAFRYNYSKSFEDPLLMMSIPEAIGHGYHSYEGYQPLRFEK